jgi:magnesium transporter
MAFISELIGRPVTDYQGKQIGVLKDVIARLVEAVPHPVVQAVLVKTPDKPLLVAYNDVAALLSKAIPLKSPIENLVEYIPQEEDIFLVRDVLDKQIIDTDDVRVVRVNDVELVRVNGSVLASNVDVGFSGLLRRAGAGWISQKLSRRVHGIQNFISWDDVELLHQEEGTKLRITVKKISELHPADIAEIISDLNRSQSSQLLESFNVKQLADALEEVEPDFQASLVEDMDDEKVADVLEEMEPDAAADLLAELPPERSEDLLELMEDEEAEDVRRLMAYPEDTAGGLMTTEYATIPPGLTASQAIDYLRANSGDAETIYYVYVIDPMGSLIGVCSLSSLVLAPPDMAVFSIMKTNVVSVNLLEEQDEVAQMVSKYNLLAVPVVDAHNCLQGIVTSDDALDKIIPTAWKKRLPRFYR